MPSALTLCLIMAVCGLHSSLFVSGHLSKFVLSEEVTGKQNLIHIFLLVPAFWTSPPCIQLSSEKTLAFVLFHGFAIGRKRSQDRK